eukprot:15300234-Alexandrium_andersonii.AAC.1
MLWVVCHTSAPCDVSVATVLSVDTAGSTVVVRLGTKCFVVGASTPVPCGHDGVELPCSQW